MRRLRGALIVIALLACAPTAEASCTFSVGSVDFGNYDVFKTTPTYSDSSIVYRCTQWESIRITLSKGSHSGTFKPRRMAGPTDLLEYYLFLGTGYSSVWGDGFSDGTVAYSASWVPRRSVTIPVYGRITALQDVSVGTYSDAVVVTINF
jgi:spore coat protein U-like protein